MAATRKMKLKWTSFGKHGDISTCEIEGFTLSVTKDDGEPAELDRPIEPRVGESWNGYIGKHLLVKGRATADYAKSAVAALPTYLRGLADRVAALNS